MAVLGLVLVGCGGNVTSRASGTGGRGGSGPGSEGGVDASAGSAGSSGASGTPQCETAADALAAKLGPAGSPCTVAVRVSPSTLAVEGYAVTCGPDAKPDGAAAQSRAETDTGYAKTIGVGCSPLKTPAGTSPSDEFVFAVLASLGTCAFCCGSGWVVAVSARSGLTVFGTIMWATAGILPGYENYPNVWQAGQGLASGCVAPVGLPPARGFQFDYDFQEILDDASVKAAVGAVWQTALPAALAKQQHIFDAVVLRYVGSSFTGGTTDEVVLVNSG